MPSHEPVHPKDVEVEIRRRNEDRATRILDAAARALSGATDEPPTDEARPPGLPPSIVEAVYEVLAELHGAGAVGWGATPPTVKEQFATALHRLQGHLLIQ